MTKDIMNSLYGCSSKASFDISFFGGVNDKGGYLATRYTGKVGIKNAIRDLSHGKFKTPNDSLTAIITAKVIDKHTCVVSHIIRTERYNNDMIKVSEHWDVMFNDGTKPYAVDMKVK